MSVESHNKVVVTNNEQIDIEEFKQIKVMKRDGVSTQAWDTKKIRNAVTNAFEEVGINPNGNFEHLVNSIACQSARTAKAQSYSINVEQIQQIVKIELMEYGYHNVAEAYIVYAHKRAELRKVRPVPDIKAVEQFVHLTRYSKWLDDEKRRELTWTETVNRSRQMHKTKFPMLDKVIDQVFDKVDQKRILPSMRSMQYGGPAQIVNNIKGYNCAFSVCNRPRFFAEAFYLLLAGTGVGYSVQFRHVEQLPALKFVDRNKVKHFIIDDNIESWADSLNELVMSYIEGYYVEFAYHKIRPVNSRLITSGGRAPGHLVLREALENIRKLLDKAQGRQLLTIECYDLVCMAAEAVYSSGIREAATICLFSIDDGLMMYAKTGEWYKTAPWRARSNNSVVLIRSEVKKDQYMRIFNATKQWGEPGFYFTDDPDSGCNPCVEIGMKSKLTITPSNKREIEKWAKKTNRTIPQLRVGEVHWGWQFCNLTEDNCTKAKTEQEFYDDVRAAAIIGTLQAAYTDFPYLGWVSEAICCREALLGVSLTGMMDNPDIALDPRIQRTAAQIVVETNIEIAEIIGINPAARCTCIKPSGTASLCVGAVGAGIHPHHARRYFRRIRTRPDDPVYQLFKKINPHMCIPINPNKELIIFPVQPAANAITRHDLGAIDFLEKVKSTMINWVLPGTARPDSSPGVNHNVSNTITVRENEWKDVAEYLWKNRQYFSGVSMISDIGDKMYQNAPREEVTTDKDEAIWRDLIDNYKEVDWSQLNESDDNTNFSGEAACAGGACSL